jgi:hypothetical protein
MCNSDLAPPAALPPTFPVKCCGEGRVVRWLSSSLENRPVDFARVGFMASVVLAGATFWISPRLPMTDLAQHAAQVTLWRDLLLDTSKWQSFLYINYFTPYLVGYGLALPLSLVMPVSAVLKL